MDSLEVLWKCRLFYLRNYFVTLLHEVLEVAQMMQLSFPLFKETVFFDVSIFDVFVIQLAECALLETGKLFSGSNMSTKSCIVVLITSI